MKAEGLVFYVLNKEKPKLLEFCEPTGSWTRLGMFVVVGLDVILGDL